MDAEREREREREREIFGGELARTGQREKDNTCTTPCMQPTLGGEADYAVTQLQCVNAPPITSVSIEPQV